MILDFLESILPPEPLGYRVAAAFTNGVGAPRHAFFKTNQELANAILKVSSAGGTIYHACAAYAEPGSRKGSNVSAVKSLWVDIDVGEKKPYKSKTEAAVAYETFRLTVGLPASWLVVSGSGLHIYQPFTKAIQPDKWAVLADLFCACMKHAGVQYDTSRSKDRASILRPPGSYNYKTSTPVLVEAKRKGEAISAADVWRMLKAYADANNIGVAARPTTDKTNELVGAHDYPPSSFSVLRKHCKAIAEVADSGGDVSYDLWWRTLGVVKFTTDKDDAAQAVTANRAATGHSKTDAAGTMAAWPVGPTTCAEFEHHSSMCASCPHAGKIKSPIQLGVGEQPAVRIVNMRTHVGADDPEYQEVVQVAVPTLPDQWGFKTPWVVEGRCKATHTGVNARGQLTRAVKTGESEDGTPVYTHVPFCDRYWQVTRRIKDVDGTWKLEITYETYPGSPPETFLFDSANVLVTDTLRKEFSARELHIYGGKAALEKASHLMISDQELLREYQQEAVTYPTMGWVTKDNSPTGQLTGEFVLGDTLFAKGKPPRQVLLSEVVQSRFGGVFSTAGSTSEWVRLIDEIYNRPGAEPYQFVIASMFAAPLVKLVPGGGEWHGIPIGLGGDSGAAKTTTALVALSMYANGQALKFNASPQQGDTINALAIKVGALKNIPCLIDELTNADTDKVSSILFMMANGQPKDRATQLATLVKNPYRWDMISLISSNDSLHDILENSNSRDAQNAGKLRLFQIQFKERDLREVFRDVSKTKVEHDLLANQYGCVGRDWIQFLVNNREKIQAILARAREAYHTDKDEGTETRFYRDLILVTYVAAQLAQQRGFIKWDVESMRAWAERHLNTLRVNILREDWETDFSEFVASLHGRTITTKEFKEGRGRRHTIEMSITPIPPGITPVARKALDDERFIVTETYVREWCKSRRIMFRQFLYELAARRMLKIQPDGTPHVLRVSIGNGTDIARPRAACYELNYQAVVGFIYRKVPPGAVVVLNKPYEGRASAKEA